jgi:glycolate oxidase
MSSEHGIGLRKKELLVMELEHMGSLKALKLMKEIKRMFDPKGLLNPGKIIT